jgi:aromatic amino acid aminotransferase I
MAPPAAIEVEAITDTAGIAIPDPLSMPIKSNEILGRRKKTNRGQWGTAAPSDTSNFRLKSYEGKPKAKRWDRMYQPSRLEGRMLDAN